MSEEAQTILEANALYHVYESKAEDGNVVALRGLHVKVKPGEAVAAQRAQRAQVRLGRRAVLAAAHVVLDEVRAHGAQVVEPQVLAVRGRERARAQRAAGAPAEAGRRGPWPPRPVCSATRANSWVNSRLSSP